MSQQPEATYQGRVLPKPDEPVYDQGLGFDLGTLMGRRQILRAFGIGAAAFGLAACSDESGTSSSAEPATSASAEWSGEIPEEVVGPYPGDGSNGPQVLTESGIIRSDITSSIGDATGKAEGVPLTVELTVSDLVNDGKAFTGAAVYIWQCDRAGLYSMYSEGAEKENYLRGVQIVDDSGKVNFTTIFPAAYTGRWPHIHFEVYPDQASITKGNSEAIAISQIAFPEEICNTVYKETGYEASVANMTQTPLASDGIFGEDLGVHEMATVTGDVSGYAATLAVGIDTTTPAGTGTMNAGAGGPGGAGMPSGGPMPSGPMPSGFPGGGMPPSGAPAPGASS
ncbi:intradiol ring-cleavage dioxygenase [Actinoplanes sp. NPDC051851]|uniref:intradiol ring-cleavage dioxygenase n=1 Tax=Actinoplanes sp. NPDC051851 TaxID=3154753 RepID=UPI003421F691